MTKPGARPSVTIPESIGPSDAHAGAQLRAARLAAGWSQSRLGETAGVSFQQVQKYERGINRIAFSTLQKFAAALGLPIEHFLHDAPAAPALAAPPQSAGYIASNQPDAAELLQLYENLRSEAARAQLLQLARLLSDAPVKKTGQD